MNLVNIYFKNPVKWDYVISIAFTVITWRLIRTKVIETPSNDFILSSVSDLANISFSSTGFILTILTVLITFKASSKKKSTVNKYDSALDFFFQTPLYAQTTNLLKDCIRSLIVIGLMGYILKIITSEIYRQHLFFFLIFSLFVLSLTLMRCLLILNKVLSLQNVN